MFLKNWVDLRMVYSPEEVDAYRKEKGCHIKRTVIIRGIRTQLFSCHRRNKNGGCTYQLKAEHLDDDEGRIQISKSGYHNHR
ncbi:hypothetical protein niasHT_028030 [Heterodera trifolii]|uniref:Uncharacterized protein n=1 Tax=Heterodera trifolii TaxID=157864 RepID=A0ABD2KFK9_9BILA